MCLCAVRRPHAARLALHVALRHHMPHANCALEPRMFPGSGVCAEGRMREETRARACGFSVMEV